MTPIGSSIYFCVEWCIFFHHWTSSSPHFLYEGISFFCFGESQDRKGDKAMQTSIMWRMRSCPWALLCCCMGPGRELNPQVHSLCSSTRFEKCSAQLWFYLYQFPFSRLQGKIFWSLTIRRYKTSFKTFMKRKSSQRAVSVKWWCCAGWNTVHRHRARTAFATQTLCNWQQLALEQAVSLPRPMHCNPRQMVIPGHCSRDAGSPELKENAAKTAGLDLSSKHKVEKHEYCPLLGTGEAHLECWILSGALQCERQHTGAEDHQDR